MASLQQQITDKFVTSLAADEDVTPEMIEALKRLLASGKKVKAEDLIAIFSTPGGGAVS